MIRRSIFSYGFIKIVMIIAGVTAILYVTKFGVGFVEGYLSSASGTYHNVIFGYSFEIPKRWELKKGTNEEAVYLTSPHDTVSGKRYERIKVEVGYVMAGRDEMATANNYFERIKSLCSGSYREHKTGSTTMKGIYSKKYSFSCVKDGIWIAVESYFLFKGGKIYMVTYMVDDREYDRRHAVFNEFMGSFKFN